jgi:hypothetical protein
MKLFAKNALKGIEPSTTLMKLFAKNVSSQPLEGIKPSTTLMKTFAKNALNHLSKSTGQTVIIEKIIMLEQHKSTGIKKRIQFMKFEALMHGKQIKNQCLLTKK